MALFNLLPGDKVLHLRSLLQFLFINLYLICFLCVLHRASAEQALSSLQGTQLGEQNIRLSWGRSPSNKQVNSCHVFSELFLFCFVSFFFNLLFCFVFKILTLFLMQSSEQPKWGGGGGGSYYGYAQGYEAYGYAPPPQDPSMYYGSYPGYTNYQQPHQV